MAGSKSVVIAAMIANGGIAVLKFFGFLLTGSPSMLAETYHSISDTGNQVLLLVGIKYSERSASSVHPFGYGKAQFFFAFLVSVLLFGVAGWESLNHGIEELRHGGHEQETGAAEFLGFTIDIDVPVDAFWIVVAILLGAIAFEVYAFVKARRELKRQMEEYGWSGYRETFDKTSDITTLTAFTEDTIALLGLGVALVGVVASEVTGNPVYDSAGAVVIGILLMVFAVLLAWENKRLILGESVPAPQERELREIVRNWEGVEEIVDFRSVYFGADRVVLSADIAFVDGMDTAEIDRTITEIEDALIEAAPDVTKIYIEPEVPPDS